MTKSRPGKHMRMATGVSLAAVGFTASADLAAVESEQYLKGEVLTEGVFQRNYTSGNDEVRDRTASMWIRARLGAKVELQDSVQVQATLVYDAEAGDKGPLVDPDSEESVEFNDAYILLKGFLRDDIHLRVGRQPISYNLRTDYGAFVYDSRAHIDVSVPRPTVTSWDGVTGYWQRESFKVIPYFYIMDEAREEYGTLQSNNSTSETNSLLGIQIDWKPDDDGDNRIFITGGASIENNPYVGDRLSTKENGDALDFGEDLITYYLGGTFKLQRGWDLYIEGAYQDGKAGGGTDFKGYGLSGGATWHFPGERDALLNLQYDYLSGDDSPNDGDFDGFVATWEGTSDTYIVEHERYGELSEMLVGNLTALKLKLEWGFFDSRLATKVNAAKYELAEDYRGEDDFGWEFDLTMDFQYNDYTRISLMGAAFLPDKGFEVVAEDVLGTDAKDDMVTFYGVAMQVLF